MSHPQAVSVQVTNRFTSSPERVFDAWLDPRLVTRWFAPELGEMVRVETDPRLGGTYSFLQRRGEELIDHVGTYQEIDRPRRLVFSWTAVELEDGDPEGRPRLPEVTSPDWSRVIIEIAPAESGCELTLTHEIHPDWADYVDDVTSAWSTMLAEIHRVLDDEGA